MCVCVGQSSQPAAQLRGSEGEMRGGSHARRRRVGRRQEMKGQAQKVSGERWEPPQRAFDFSASAPPRPPPRYGKTFAGRSWHCWRRGEQREEGKIEGEGWREGGGATSSARDKAQSFMALSHVCGWFNLPHVTRKHLNIFIRIKLCITRPSPPFHKLSCGSAARLSRIPALPASPYVCAGRRRRSCARVKVGSARVPSPLYT